WVANTFGSGGSTAGLPRKLPAVSCDKSRDSTRARRAGSPPQAPSRYWERAAGSGRSSTARKISRSVIAKPSGGRALVATCRLRVSYGRRPRNNATPRRNHAIILLLFRIGRRISQFPVQPRPGERPNAVRGARRDAQG